MCTILTILFGPEYVYHKHEYHSLNPQTTEVIIFQI